MHSPAGTACSVQLTGWAAERFERARLAMDNFAACLWWHAAKPPGWGYEAPLRWLANMCLVYRYNGYRHPRITEVYDRILELAPTTAERRIRGTAPIWCVGLEAQFIPALLEYHGTFDDDRALEYAARIGRNIADTPTRGDYYIGMLAGKMLALARATGDDSFAATAARIADEQQLTMLGQPNIHGAAGTIILSGYAHLYQHTGEKRYLDWAVTGWQAFRKRMFATGGIGEILDFTAPPGNSHLHGETCNTVDWFLLNLDLWRATGRATYLDLAERIFYNQYLAHQLHLGDGPGFSAINDIDQGFRGNHNYICCDNEGMLGLLKWLPQLYDNLERPAGIRVNWLVPSETTRTLADGTPVRLVMETDYPVTGHARLTVRLPRPTRFALEVRIPGGETNAAALLVNGEPVPVKKRGVHLRTERTWQNDDVVTALFPVRQRVEVDNTGHGPASAPVHIRGRNVLAKRVAVMHGPVVAAIFRTAHNNDLSWIWTGDYPEVPDSGGSAFEEYPGSKSDVLETNRAEYHAGGPPERTEIGGGDHDTVTLRWSRVIRKPMQDNEFSATVTVHYEVRVLPGLPVRLECRETIDGWNGAREQLRLLAGGVRFGVLKTNTNQRYNVKQMGWYYPFPAVTTKPDLNHIGGCENGNGTFSAYERLTDYGVLSKTGVWMLNNGYFRVICLYDPEPVARLTARSTPNWAGIYCEPYPGPRVELRRTLVFPLHAVPLAQHRVCEQLERAGLVRARIVTGPDGNRDLVLEGELVADMPIRLEPTLGLKPGDLLVNGERAAPVYGGDDTGALVANVTAPGTYRVQRLS